MRAADHLADLAAPPVSVDAFLLDRPDWVDPRVDDIVKLVARFVAAGGEDFIAELAPRESRNPDFAFLQSHHGLHSYYKRVLAAYRTVLQLPQDIRDRVQALAEDASGYRVSLNDCVYRMKWAERAKKSQENDADVAARQRAMANVDWHDFVVVATIDFEVEDEGEASGVVAAAAAAAKAASGGKNKAGVAASGGAGGSGGDDSEDDDDADMDMSEDDDDNDNNTNNNGNDDESIHVLSDYVPSVSGREVEQTQVLDPATGQALPVDAAGEHMRVELLDPQWRQQRDRFLAKQKKTNQISEEQISNRLRKFAENRPDIFKRGEGEQGGVDGVGAADGSSASSSSSSTSSSSSSSSLSSSAAAPKKPAVVWDGRTGSIAQVREAALNAREEMEQHENELRARGRHPDQLAAKKPVIGPVVPSGLPPLPPAKKARVLDLPSGMPPPLLAPLSAAPSGRGRGGGDGSSGPVPDILPTRMPAPAILGNMAMAAMQAGPVSAAEASNTSAVLVAGSEWIELCAGQLTLRVDCKIPYDADHIKDWATAGQMIVVETKVTETVASLKDMLQAKMGGKIPLNKFQLKHDVLGFVKDRQTFADLNFRTDVELHVHLKTRKRRR